MKPNDATTKSYALVAATMASFLTPFMGSSINIALPAIGKEFAMDAVLLSWVPTSFLLSAAVFLLPIGRLADIHGRKKTFTWGIVVYSLSALTSGISTTPLMLIASRIGQGLGSAMIFGTAAAILTSVFPVGERGKALGINVAAVYLGLSMGPFLGGVLTENLGWRSIFVINVPMGLLILVFVIWKLRGEWAEARGEKFDVAGSMVYMVTMVAIMYGFSRLPEMSGRWLILLGAGGLCLFVFWESRAKSPVLDISLFKRSRVFTFSNLAALIHYGATFAVSFLLSLYLQYIKGLSPQEAGTVLVCQPVIMAIFSPAAGRLSDRIEPRVVASVGMALTACGILLFTSLGRGTHLALVLAGLLLLGFGFALFSSPNTNAVMSSVEKKFLGVASGMVGTMRLTGQMLSMGIAMLVFAVYLGKAQITPETYPLFLKGIRTLWMIFAVLCTAGILASLARGKLR